jgi:DNA-binding response OmpR family regulator
MANNSRHILIVDDEELVCSLLEDYLSDCGYRVSTAHSGKAGLEVINAETVDCAIVDMRLPDMGGRDFILNADEWSPQTVFFIHTGSLDYTVDKVLMDKGLTQDSIIFKPIKDLAFLSEKIDKVLS